MGITSGECMPARGRKCRGADKSWEFEKAAPRGGVAFSMGHCRMIGNRFVPFFDYEIILFV